MYSLREDKLEQKGWTHSWQKLHWKEPWDLRIGLLQTGQGNILRLGGPGLGWMSPQLRRKDGKKGNLGGMSREGGLGGKWEQGRDIRI